MSKGLKGITVTIDGNATPLNKALSSVNANAKSLQSELKGVNSLLKLDPKNTELAAQKQVILKQAVSETEEKLKLLTQAEKEMAEAGKDVNDEGYRDLQREIALTKSKLSDYKTELKAVEDQQKKAAKEAETLGTKIYNIASKIPVVNKLADGFVKVKGKITETVKESEAVKKIGTTVEGAKQKVEAFKDAHPAVQKVADAFGKVKTAANEVKEKIPPLSTQLKAVGDVAASAAKGGFTVLTNVVGGTMKAFAGFATAVVGAGVAVTKSAVEQYAEYEQLVGGVETLFKDSAGQVEGYANNAYKTAGMSANQYMNTVTGFSASLLQSLDGDTKAAAEKADMAITDMSDNANKMGTSIDSIQTAYQGFAKQNYTMLDNLKLGYGGTKEEMQRLLDDATKLSGVKYDISSYADIVDAIHVVQTEMGITGTTAKEASTTIEGSINSTKAAWSNLLTGFANDEADVGALITDLCDSVATAANNLIPRVIQAVTSIVENVPIIIQGLAGTLTTVFQEGQGLITSLMQPLIDAFFGLINAAIALLPTLLPEVLNAAISLFQGILDGLNQTIPNLLAMLPVMIQNITDTLTANLPQIVASGIEILVNLINGITNAIPSLIQAVIDLFPVIVNSIMENLPQIIQAGLDLLIALINGIVSAIPQLIAMLPTIITTIVSTLTGMLPQIIQAGITLLQSLINGIISAIPQLIAAVPQIITSVVNTLTTNLPKILQMGIELIGSLISGLIQAIPALIAAVPQIISAIWDTIMNTDWLSLGKNIIGGVIQGVKNAASSLIQVFKDLASSALDAVKDFFGIHSPSRVMRDQVGKMIPAGMAEGVEDGMDEEEDRIKEAMRKGVPTTIDSYINTKSGSASYATQTAAGGFTQNITINSPKELSPSEVARQTRNQTRQMVLKLKAG